jgi:hypothetical protein
MGRGGRPTSRLGRGLVGARWACPTAWPPRAGQRGGALTGGSVAASQREGSAKDLEGATGGCRARRRGQGRTRMVGRR